MGKTIDVKFCMGISVLRSAKYQTVVFGLMPAARVSSVVYAVLKHVPILIKCFLHALSLAIS